MKNEPHYVHDCNGGEFLGHYLGHDVYYHEPPKDNTDRTLGRTYVARFGDEYGDFVVHPCDLVANAETFNHVVQTDIADEESDIGLLAIAVALAVRAAQEPRGEMTLADVGNVVAQVSDRMGSSRAAGPWADLKGIDQQIIVLAIDAILRQKFPCPKPPQEATSSPSTDDQPRPLDPLDPLVRGREESVERILAKRAAESLDHAKRELAGPL
jgi:hypothetical protein